MPNDIYFRSAIAGYNKNDVMRFIEKLNADQVERVNELNDQIRTSQTEVRKLAAEAEVLKKRCDELEYTLTLRGKGDVINAEKAQKYDEMQKNYADIMLDAESSSKEKIRQAEEQGEKIITDANLYFEDKKKALLENKEKLISANKNTLKASLKELEDVLNKLSVDLERSWEIIGKDSENE